MRYESLDPEARERVDEIFAEHSSGIDFICEIISPIKDGSMSDDEARHWLESWEKTQSEG